MKHGFQRRRGPRGEMRMTGAFGRDRGSFEGPDGAPFGDPFGPPFSGPGFSGPGFSGPGFGGPGFGGPGRHPHHGRGRRGDRAGRGDVRAAILLLLAEAPMHGYQLIKEIAERTEGRWRPSPGAIYPALNLLQDEGLVEISAEGGRRLAALTEEGLAYVTTHAAELGDPWKDAAARGPRHGHELRAGLEAVAGAVRQVAFTGTTEQAQAALALLERSRRELYLILAGAPPTDAPAPADTDPTEPSDTPE
jgi:DNA-binding PadR family transcriptional regulator